MVIKIVIVILLGTILVIAYSNSNSKENLAGNVKKLIKLLFKRKKPIFLKVNDFLYFRNFY